MKIADLITKLQSQPDHNVDVQLIVFEQGTGTMVCAEMAGPATEQIIAVIGKHHKRKKQQ